MPPNSGLFVGTSGWHYDHWRGLFYPDHLPKSEWFAYYAGHFGTVELNNSFYRQPKAATWDNWRNGAPDSFRFAVKANRYITHLLRFRNSGQPLKRFLEGATRLGEHLGPLLYQAPPDFELNEQSYERLDGFLTLLPRDLRHVFEFRHDTWFDRAGIDLLRKYGVGFCVQDMPGLQCPVLATANHAYVRLHGAGSAYRGNYGEQALQEWAARIRDLARDGAAEVWVYFNNDLEGHAVANAGRLKEILGAS